MERNDYFVGLPRMLHLGNAFLLFINLCLGVVGIVFEKQHY